MPLCPSRRGLVHVGLRTGRIAPLRCERLDCPVCIVVEAFKVAGAIALACPTHALRVSLVGDSWPIAQRRMNRLREYLSAEGDAGEWIWHVECNPAGTGHHAHVWMHGDQFPDQSELSRCAVRAGLGADVYVESIRTPLRDDQGLVVGAGAMSYGMKAVLVVPTDLDKLTPEQSHYLEVNGRRLFHASRGFWRDGRGNQLHGKRAAISGAQRGRQQVRERWSVPMTKSAAVELRAHFPAPRSLFDPRTGPARP